MKRKLCKIFIFMILLLGFTNVYAEEVSVKDLPKNYTTRETGGYEFTIEGFELRVYDINVQNDDEGFDKYIDETPSRTIPLNTDELTINLEVKEKTIQDVPATIVGLNLNLTKEKLETYLATEKTNATADKAYLVELVVKYKLTKPKVETTYKYNINLVRDFFGSLANENYKFKEVSTNSTIIQTLNIIVVEHNNETNQNIIEYETNVTEENNIAAYVLNYLVLSNEESTTSKKTGTDMLMFHNIDNIDYLIENLSETEDNPQDDIKDKIPGSNTQTVAVPNTAATIPSLVYIISIVMIVLGAGIITYTVVKE